MKPNLISWKPWRRRTQSGGGPDWIPEPAPSSPKFRKKHKIYLLKWISSRLIIIRTLNITAANKNQTRTIQTTKCVQRVRTMIRSTNPTVCDVERPPIQPRALDPPRERVDRISRVTHLGQHRHIRFVPNRPIVRHRNRKKHHHLSVKRKPLNST